MDTQVRLNAMESYGLASAEDLTRFQDEANDAIARSAERSALSALTYETAMADAHEALVGLAADLAGTTDRTSLWDMLTHQDRMRGLGVLLMALALVGLVVDYIMMPVP